LLESGEKSFTVEPMDRLAQLIIVPIVHASFEITETFEQRARGRRIWQ
jgi:dUTP pyrophosphatase